MSEAEQNRSEQPTSYKLARAREKGTVARGADLGFVIGLAAFCGYAWLAGPAGVSRIAHASQVALVTGPGMVDSSNAVLQVTGEVLSSAVRPLGFMAATVFLAVLVFEIIQLRGLVFSTEPLRPDFSRLNPANGFKRVFSVRMLIETGKNILKMAVYVGVAFLVIRQARSVDAAAVTDAMSLGQVMARTGGKLVVMFIGVAVVFAAIDQLITRRDFTKRMRMSRREVRRESRDREGDPRMKQRRKQLHREFVSLSQSLRGVRDADVMIVNPTHYAVALKYTPATMAAPIVVSQGTHQFAQRLKRLAFIYGVVTIENAPLARALYHRTELNRPIPDEYFQPVADIYLRIRERTRIHPEASADA